MHDFKIVAENPERRTFSILIGETSRFFAGHFPGRPVLPAIAHLAIVARLLQRSLGEDARIVAIERLRMMKTVLPGDHLEIRIIPIEDDPDPAARFTIDRRADRVGEGILRWARAVP